MKKPWLTRIFPWGVTILLACYVVSGFRDPVIGKPFHLADFGRLPALNGGRIKPLDTIARTSLLVLRGKQTVRVEKRSLSAVEWMADMLFRPEEADRYKVFEIDDPDVLGLMNIQQTQNRTYSFADLHPFLRSIQDQAMRAEQVKPEQRSRFQGAILGLQNKLILYQKIQNTVQVAGAPHVSTEYRQFLHELAPLMLSHMTAGKGNAKRLQELSGAMDRYRFMADVAEFMPLPGTRGMKKDDWVSVGQGLLDAVSLPQPHPGIAAFAAMGDSFRAQNAEDFNKALASYRDWLDKNQGPALSHANREQVFNRFEPFYRSIVLYVLVFLMIFASWLIWPEHLTRTAFTVLLLAFLVHTGGLVSRMVLQGRPPVTNLYSSAIFVGWAAVLLGIILERFYRNGMGSLVSAVIGFLTLIVAHHLTSQGDTLEMMRAVLDSNFWLATHVVTITIGYSSTFLAGFLAIVFVVRRVFDRGWNPTAASTLDRMVYGIVCFSLLLSFIGTILGGIWADQSWGRFWGWDPKENGALLIVIWNAFILHARLGGLANQRTVMVLTIFGNIVTAFSWFGVNMLGVGLHSYGFMDKAFLPLLFFTLLQGFFMLLGVLPDYMTRRFAPTPTKRS